MSKPKVFVSSTFYDLKYVRERIERFISEYCFEPILFESDDVFFSPDKPLDKSCYNEVANCHLMVLIVGGRYGSLISDSTNENYEKQYISITRREYETAKAKGIPVMIFVDQNVYTEYRTYQKNKKSLPADFKFAFVDDIKVFEFISVLEQNAIKAFSKVDDIEYYFAHQIAGMLLTYLKQIQEKKSSDEIKTAVDEIKVVSQSMQQMVNSIAKTVLKGNEKYKELLDQQNRALIDFFFELVDMNIKCNSPFWKLELDNIENNETGKKECAKQICKIIRATIFNLQNIVHLDEIKVLHEYWEQMNKMEEDCSSRISALKENLEIHIDFHRLKKHLSPVLALIQRDANLNDYFNDKLFSIIYSKLSLPF